MSSIFGGSQQQSQSTSSSSNQAYPYLQQALGGNVSNGSNAGNQLASMLGLNGTPAQATGFNNFRNSTGYQFGLNQGIQSITGNAATQGLLNSGSTLKALDTYGQNYANTQYGNYTSMLQNLLSGGNTSASVIGGAGNVYNSQSTGSGSSNGGGIGGAIGSLLGKGGAGISSGGSALGGQLAAAGVS
jgi:hypothetical protein